jgi:restriction system protein
MKDLFLILLFVGIGWLLWQFFASKKSIPPAQSTQIPKEEDSGIRHLRHTLEFAKAQHKVLTKKQHEQDAWQLAHGNSKVAELDRLGGAEFETFLAGLFRAQGYAAEHTPTTGDYGADLILSKDGQRIAVQAKRYVGSVGVAAVQEALSGQAYYQCDTAWLVTTGTFTANALELARKCGVEMIDRSDIGKLMTKHTDQVQFSNFRQTTK